jgi:hypothetical protein
MGHDKARKQGARGPLALLFLFSARRQGHLYGPSSAIPTTSMSSPLLDVWEAASASPYNPSVAKGVQFTLGFALLFTCACL